jgi:hypothetical protein
MVKLSLLSFGFSIRQNFNVCAMGMSGTIYLVNINGFDLASSEIMAIYKSPKPLSVTREEWI